MTIEDKIRFCIGIAETAAGLAGNTASLVYFDYSKNYNLEKAASNAAWLIILSSAVLIRGLYNIYVARKIEENKENEK